jgi:hypothetical protein
VRRFWACYVCSYKGEIECGGLWLVMCALIRGRYVVQRLWACYVCSYREEDRKMRRFWACYVCSYKGKIECGGFGLVVCALIRGKIECGGIGLVTCCSDPKNVVCLAV